MIGFYVTALALVAGDQLTKRLAWRYLDSEVPRSYFHDTLRLVYVENGDGFLGLFRVLPEGLRFLLLTGGVVVAVVLGIVYIMRRSPLPRSTVVAVLLVLEGGVSNLVDRLIRGGRVIDFLNLGFGDFRTGIFNLADVSIFVGSFVLGAMWFQREGCSQGTGMGFGRRQ